MTGSTGAVRVLALAVLALLGVLGVAALPAAAAPARIMPIGDSITEGTGADDRVGFRNDLHTLLTGAGQDFVFVGSNGDSPLRGHFKGGTKIRQFYPSGFGNGWGTGFVDVTPDMSVLRPDLVLIHLATNDINSNFAPFAPYSYDHQHLYASASGRMAELIMYLLGWSDGTRGDFLESVVVSQIVPMQFKDADARAFNEAIGEMAEDFVEGNLTGRPERILVADHHGRLARNSHNFTGDASDWMDDYLHPNDAGYAQMAEVYADAAIEALTDFTAPDPPVLATGSRTARELVLGWAAPGDDGAAGRALRYDLRYAEAPITETSFRDAIRFDDEPAPGPAGALESLRISGLAPGRTYHFALRVVDDAANRSQLAILSRATSESDRYATDDFELLGAPWRLDPGLTVAGGSLVAAGGAPGLENLAVFSDLDHVESMNVVLGPGTTGAGMSGFGLVLRLEDSRTNADGYVVMRRVGAERKLRLLALRGGIAREVADERSPLAADPGPGDRISVVTSSSASGHRFRVLVNGVLDGELVDAQRRTGNASRKFAGLLFAGGAAAAVDRVDLVGPDTPLFPEAPGLLAPADGAPLVPATPTFTWTPAYDPNPGETVRYVVYLDTDPRLASPDSTGPLAATSFSPAAPLPAATTFTWTVRAIDASGRSRVAAARVFRTAGGSAGVGGDEAPGREVALRLEPNAPNPFNPATRIRFALAAPGPVGLVVYDAAGRVVKELVRGPLEAGEHEVVWRGDDASGREAASGVYFYRLEAAGQVLARKMVLAR
jgi:lysophospholipase L1-like esterase